MQPPVTRRWPTLAELMILTAATGLAAAMLRPYLAGIHRPIFGLQATQERIYGYWSFFGAWWMLALLLIHHRGRVARPCLARPGQVACLAALAALAAGSIQVGIRIGLGGWPVSLLPMLPYVSWIGMSDQIGPTVFGAWVILAASGRWRADPGWIDRLGRLLGACWIAWSFHLIIPFNMRNAIYQRLIP